MNALDTLTLLNNIPGAIGYKNKESMYIGGNQQLALHMGYTNSNDLIGLTDFDIKSEMVDFADRYIEQDKEVLNSGIQQHIDIGRYPDGDLQIHFSTKKMLLDKDNEVMGTIFTCITLNSSLLNFLYHNLVVDTGPGFYTIGGHFKQYNLKPKESKCLFYLIRGYTAKEIAKKIYISPKTVEYHIEQLKNKLSASNKSELIEKAIHLGFVFNIPLSIASDLV